VKEEEDVVVVLPRQGVPKAVEGLWWAASAVVENASAEVEGC
jgi:hypothetical protein